jgi:hypothetical protein
VEAATMAREQLDTAAVAARLEVTPASVRRYMMADRAQYGFPAPDGHIGRSPWWWSTTIDKWNKHRAGNPGRGGAQPGAGRPRKAAEPETGRS